MADALLDLLNGPAQGAAPAMVPTGAGPDPLLSLVGSIPTNAPASVPASAPAQPALKGSPVSFMGRVGQGILDPLNAGAQFLAHSVPDGVSDAVNSATRRVNDMPVLGPVTKAMGMTPATPGQIDQNINTQENQYQANRAASGSTGFDGARMIGNVVGTAPLALAAPAGAGMATGAVLGAANGALTPVFTQGSNDSYAKQKAYQVGLGVATGGLAAPVMSGFGKVVSGVGDAAQQLLAKAGVTMTPGQILGGALARTEDKLTSVPVVGDLIKNAQQRSVQSFNRATYSDVLDPINPGAKYTGPVGTEGVANVKQAISDAYDSALSKLNFTVKDPNFIADVNKLGGMAQSLPAAQAKTFSNVLDTQVFGKIGPQGVMTGDTLKGVQSELSRISRGYLGDPSFDNQQLGHAIAEVKNAVDASLARTNPADAVKGLQNANAAYANFVRLRSAAGSVGAGNNGGIFTPAQLASAVRANDKSVGKGAYATGDALMQDLSSAGQNVLGSKYPDSGTPGRSMLAAGAAALAGHSYLPSWALPMVAGAGGAAALPYTSTGQKIAQALLMKRPPGAQQAGEAISQYGSALAPAFGPAAAAALLNGSNR